GSCSLLRPARPPSTLFPYTTLFRSGADEGLRGSGGQLVDEVPAESECPADSGDAHLVLDETLQDPGRGALRGLRPRLGGIEVMRSEEHTSELQSRFDLVCRLLLEKK